MRSLFAFIFIISTISFAQETKNDSTRIKVGVVLSGGGAKGYAHVGALKKIEEAGESKLITSEVQVSGAIIGGLYAAGYTPDELEKSYINWIFLR